MGMGGWRPSCFGSNCCTTKAVCAGALLWWSTQVLLRHLYGHFPLIYTLSCLGGHSGTSHWWSNLDGGIPYG
jgi:hypothetical protein